jgi:hypothetical protein
MKQRLATLATLVLMALAVGCDSGPKNQPPPDKVPAAPGPIGGTGGGDTPKPSKGSDKGMAKPPNIVQD